MTNVRRGEEQREMEGDKRGSGGIRKGRWEELRIKREVGKSYERRKRERGIRGERCFLVSTSVFK